MDCRLLVDAPRSGPQNMAIDQAMLERAARENVMLARIYGWQHPTLSLGYFQRVSDQQERPATLGMPLVRRTTGGGAIVHHHDWTYSIAVPTAAEAVGNIGASSVLYDQIHASVIEWLQGLGWDARRCEAATRPICGKCSFLCFERRSAGDVLIGEHKVMGSAQRRMPGGLLQHGSLLLARSPHAPSLLGLEDISPKGLDENRILTGFQLAISQGICRLRWITDDSNTNTESVSDLAGLIPEHAVDDLHQFADSDWTQRLP